MKTLINRRSIAALAIVASASALFVGTPGDAAETRLRQETPMSWHPQSGNAGEVSDGAQATIVRKPNGIRYSIRTTDLVPGNAYSVWFVTVNDPASCHGNPCTAPQIIGDPAVDAQVIWGGDGAVARAGGGAAFEARVAAGPLLSGWLDVQGLDDPMGAEIHLVLNDHGPVIQGMRADMISTYRGGCSDESPFPSFFPAKALADGDVGPNTCLLFQSATFLSPADS